ncbi:MAG: hypothetical protein J6L70_02890 [Alphaproteobacteria bacterium]|nr:hypothetical protein [Alphaproteobacteria bacterium]
MKTVCDFCKTEYNMSARAGSTVRCAICGNTWTVAAPARRNTFLMFFASLCALLSAIIFVVAVIVTNRPDPRKQEPLYASVTGHQVVTTADGVRQLVVTGTIQNQTDDIYGVPDLEIILRDATGRIISRQKFMPSATLLDAGASSEFRHVLSAPVTSDIKSIDVRLLTNGGAKK